MTDPVTEILVVEQRPLHAGFAAAWPALREIIESR